MGIRPEGKTLIVNNIEGPRLIPPGTYDIGDGFYDPAKRMICNYDGSFKRNMEPGEEDWIVSKCRYNPSMVDDPSQLSGENDSIIQEMIELNNDPALRAARERGQTNKAAQQKWNLAITLKIKVTVKRQSLPEQASSLHAYMYV